MTRKTLLIVAALAAIAGNLILISCSETSTAPKVGTPPFFWAAAKETYAQGDYVKTLEHLDKLTSSDNEFIAKALPWQLVLTAGMVRGYMDLADNFEGGAKMNRVKTVEFRKQVTNYRGTAGRMTLHFADLFAKMQQNKAEYVPLAFAYPPGIPTPVVALTKISNGQLLPEAELENVQKRAVERAVLLTTCEAAGAPDDPAKTQDLLKGENPLVSRSTFIMAMSTSLYNQALLYQRNKLDDPEKLKALCARVQEALKSIPESKQTKDLNSKIESTLKKAKG